VLPLVMMSTHPYVFFLLTIAWPSVSGVAGGQREDPRQTDGTKPHSSPRTGSRLGLLCSVSVGLQSLTDALNVALTAV